MINWLEHWTKKKPQKRNSTVLARIERNKDIERNPARRMSYKKFWRRQQKRLQKFEKRSTRRQRRMVAHFLYHRLVKKRNA